MGLSKEAAIAAIEPELKKRGMTAYTRNSVEGYEVRVDFEYHGVVVVPEGHADVPGKVKELLNIVDAMSEGIIRCAKGEA